MHFHVKHASSTGDIMVSETRVVSALNQAQIIGIMEI